MRDEVDDNLRDALPAAFTKPIAAEAFGNTLEEKGIAVEPDFMLMEVDNDEGRARLVDEREVPFDLLVTVPLNMGADCVARSGLGNELNLVPVDKFTQQAKAYPRTSSPWATPTTSRRQGRLGATSRSTSSSRTSCSTSPAAR